MSTADPPESLEFLVARRPANALKRANHILARMGRSTWSELPPSERRSGEGSPLQKVLGPRIRLQTLMLWIGYACLVAAYYFANTWLPKIIATSTVTTRWVLRPALSPTSVGSSDGSSSAPLH